MEGGPGLAAWGKFEGAERGGPCWHPLIDHCADVAACCEALLRQPILARRLSRLAGIETLDEVLIARLSAIAFLHDLGKANWGFQHKIRPGSKTWDAGHVGEVYHLLDETRPLLAAFLEAVPLEEMVEWMTGNGFSHLLYASISHHGIPWNGAIAKGNPAYWEPNGRYDPFQTLHDLGAKLRLWFPDAFKAGTPPFIAKPAFQHAFAGIVMLADWLGSDIRMFPFSKPDDGERMVFARGRANKMLKDIGLDVRSKLMAVTSRSLSFYDIFEVPLYEMQKAVRDLVPTPLAILESETGSGKTEAALWHFKALFEAGLVDGLYFALPTRVAATQIHRRICDAVSRIFPAQDRPEVLLALPGYAQVDGVKAKILPGFEVLWPDEPDGREAHRRWAAENPKRFLAAQIAVGTIDQALLSNLKIKHAHLRSTALLRHLLVVDEVHASDAYMSVLLKSVLNVHLAAGGYAFLMSATLGAATRTLFLEGARTPPPPLEAAVACPYPAISWRDNEDETQVQEIPPNKKEKHVAPQLAPIIDEPNAIAAAALKAARAGAKVLVVRNTVNAAIAIQMALEDMCDGPADRRLLFRCGDVVTLHHGRFAREDRTLIDQAVEARMGKSRPDDGGIIVGTQTLEQSLDIDADFLITDLCPMDVLLQRIGRLHRHDRPDRPQRFESACCLVLIPEERDFSPDKGAGRRHGLGKYIYEDIRVIEATLRLLETTETLSIPAMNRELVERATHPDALAALSQELGDAWREDGNRIIGLKSAQANVANQHRIRRDKPFGEETFPGIDEKLRTRLGEDDRLVEWPEGTELPMGPFGQPVKRLSVPAHLCKGSGPDAEASLGVRRADGFSFALGAHTYDYSRFGLRKIDKEA